MERSPLRISIIGIDGSGKSTTTLRAIYSLGREFSVCKTGRMPFFIREGSISPCLPRIGRFFEDLFKKVDATKRRGWIGLSRLFFVLFQGFLEPYMIKRYRPDLIMTTRCMVIDPAVYSDFYFPALSRNLTTKSKLKLSQQYSRLPFRDLYFFLDTPIPMAIRRIHKRISDDHPEITYGRDYWLHLHEHEGSLQLFDQKFRDALNVARRMASFRVIEIDTAKYDEGEVSELISRYTVDFCKDGLTENWMRV